MASGVLAAGLVVLLTAAAMVAYLINDAAGDIVEPLVPLAPEAQRQLDRPRPGEAQTILLVGLDHRYADGPKAKSRSDTMILVRLDPNARATSVLTLPRDLRVAALGGQKLNTAWFSGGPALLTRTIKTSLLGSPERPFPINDVVSVKFDAFARTINHFGCLYAEVDRHYFVAPNTGHAAIDQPAGYQLLCGQDALSYVRFRVQDSDLIRAARQANYITEVRSQVDPLDVLTGSLLQEVGQYVETNIKTPRQLLGIAKLLVYVTGKPTARISLGGLSDAQDGSNDILTTPAALEKARRQFFDPSVPKGQAVKPPPTTETVTIKAPKAPDTLFALPPLIPAPTTTTTTTTVLPGVAAKKRARRVRGALPPTMVTDAAGADRSAGIVRRGASGLRLFVPSARYRRGAYEDRMTRGYAILGKNRRPRWPSYRIVVATGESGQYYGVEGTTWKDPPILQLATDRIRLGGRTWDVQYDGRRIRRLIWRAPQGTYWVTNTLTNQLTSKEMYALAHSFRRVR
ncbi:LCP family protein [Patulibacter minatonensis]|uniref:LCP family protein n=1 Tax=Patulibacter minatonensis TaxID=298163 RepID=UPI00047C8679|nr:LCP family protein [Patulibacter minatonensis]